jgi:hypothetical protein
MLEVFIFALGSLAYPGGGYARVIAELSHPSPSLKRVKAKLKVLGAFREVRRERDSSK